MQRTRTPDAVPALVADARQTFATGLTKGIEWRRAQLEALERLLTENDERLLQALYTDLKKPSYEAWLTEIAPVQLELKDMYRNLPTWSLPRRVPSPLHVQPAASLIEYQPKGVVLVISAYNYPISLALNKLAAALCAGNVVVLKLSEVAPACERLLAELLEQYLCPRGGVRVVTGGVDVAEALLKERFDHIFFTGSPRVGRFVAAAAARHLTPVTLELGGKNPTVVLKGADLVVAARRVLSSKVWNAGQICIAPDYLLVEQSIYQEFVETLRAVLLEEFFPEGQAKSESYCRMVNQGHFDRVMRLAEEAVALGENVARVLFTGDDAAGTPVGSAMVTASRDEKYIPTCVIQVTAAADGCALMREEIFGPLLPVRAVADADEALAIIKAREAALALYVFGPPDSKVVQQLVAESQSGGVCVNDTIFHYSNSALPFGGVGESGMGAYHGEHGFREFSHARAVMYRGTFGDAPIRYPPYRGWLRGLLERVLIGPLLSARDKKMALVAGGLASGVWLHSRL